MTLREFGRELLGARPSITIWAAATIVVLLVALVAGFAADDMPLAKGSSAYDCSASLTETATVTYSLAWVLAVTGTISAFAGIMGGEGRRGYFAGAFVFGIVEFAVLLGISVDIHWGSQCRPFN